MAKVADVKIFWVPSPTADIVKVEVFTTINGAETKVEVGPEVQDLMVEVSANGSVAVKFVVTDSEGLKATSESYTFTLGDLEAPLPITGVGHEVIAIRDAPDPTPTPA